MNENAVTGLAFEPLVSPILILLCLLTAGCDIERDDPVWPADVDVLATTCQAHGGLKKAQRAMELFSTTREWRVDCANSARFVILTN